jgi:hypothetical protein
LSTASAIWLRALFPVQTNSTRRGGRVGIADTVTTQLPQQPPEAVFSPVAVVVGPEGTGSEQHPGPQQGLVVEFAADMVSSPIKIG